MSTNTVCSARTVQFDSPAGPLGVIIMNLHVADPRVANASVREAADKFKLQRLSSPLRTETLLITITGELSADRFSQGWRLLVIEDATLALMMSQLHRAEVVHTPTGQGSSATVSLLPAAAPEFPRPDASTRRESHAPVPSDSCSALVPLLAGSASA
jgi:hypothetical protein